MRFLFTTLQFEETDFFRRVGAELVRRGHEAVHLTVSRHAAETLREAGWEAHCLPDMLREADPGDGLAREVARIEAHYPIRSLRDVWRTDKAATVLPENEALERTVRHFLAIERLFDRIRPDAVVPEVGSETMRFVTHLVARDRGATLAYIFQTIFPGNLRLYLDEFEGPIVPPEEVRPLTPEEREEAEEFVRGYTAARKPTLAHRKARVTRGKLRDFVRHLRVKRTHDRDNEYLVPHRFVTNYVRQRVTAALVRRMCEPLEASVRPFVYFPLHVTDDFKVKRTIPHCVDQAALIEQVAEALPQGYDVVLKEHPWAIGKVPASMLRRLTQRPNIRLVDAYTNSHDLIQRSSAVIVISSTVGLEALLYAHPVLTLGRPFFGGYEITMDVGSFAELHSAVPAVLRYRPDPERCLQFVHACMRAMYVGKTSNADPSDENARNLAESLERAISARRGEAERQPMALERLREGELALTG